MKKILLLFCFQISIFPDLIAQDLDQAKQLMYYERIQSAGEALETILTRSPDSEEAYYLLSQVYLLNQESEKARRVIKNSNGKVGTPLLQVAMGHLLLSEGKATESAEYFNKALESTKKKDESIIYAIGKAHIQEKAGDPSYALKLLDEAAKKNKRNPAFFVTIGDAYRRLIDGGNAVKNYQKALELDKSNAEALYKIGKIYLSQQNKEMFVKYFEDAIAADPKYAPAYYELFHHYYYRDVNRAKTYLEEYIRNSDPDIEHQYMTADLLFVSKKYPDAISAADKIILSEKEKSLPRIFKLLAYSHDALKDSIKARQEMEKYFSLQEDSLEIPQDYAFHAELLKKFPGNEVQAVQLLEKSAQLDTNVNNKLNYVNDIVAIYKEKKDKHGEAYWLGEVYRLKPSPNNRDIFNWGLALFMSQQYQRADSVFTLYTEKYPDQLYGYYWRARSLGVIDSTMETGAAIPMYEKVIEVAWADTAKNKNVLIQGNSYLAIYEANIRKDYAKAIGYLENILVLDPENTDAMKNRDILKKQLGNGSTE